MIGSGPTEISDGDFRLREIRREDSESLYRWRMGEDARPMFVNGAVVPFETHQAYLERYFQPENTDRWFIIERRGAPVGTLAFYDLDPEQGEYEWGRLVVAPEARGHGAALAALRLLMRYGRLIGLRRIRSEVLETNHRVTATQDELGMTRVAIRERDGRRFVIFRVEL